MAQAYHVKNSNDVSVPEKDYDDHEKRGAIFVDETGHQNSAELTANATGELLPDATRTSPS